MPPAVAGCHDVEGVGAPRLLMCAMTSSLTSSLEDTWEEANLSWQDLLAAARRRAADKLKLQQVQNRGFVVAAGVPEAQTDEAGLKHVFEAASAIDAAEWDTCMDGDGEADDDVELQFATATKQVENHGCVGAAEVSVVQPADAGHEQQRQHQQQQHKQRHQKAATEQVNRGSVVAAGVAVGQTAETRLKRTSAAAIAIKAAKWTNGMDGDGESDEEAERHEVPPDGGCGAISGSLVAAGVPVAQPVETRFKVSDAPVAIDAVNWAKCIEGDGKTDDEVEWKFDYGQADSEAFLEENSKCADTCDEFTQHLQKAAVEQVENRGSVVAAGVSVAQWERRSATLAAEIVAVSDTIAILTADDNREALAVTSMMQADSSSNAMARHMQAAEAWRRAAQAPESEADDLRAAWHGRKGPAPSTGAAVGPRAQLSALAMAVQPDFFTKAKAMMDEMVAQWKKQQQEEVDFRAYGTKEVDENGKAEYAKNEEKNELKPKSTSLKL